jgi:DNA-binding CsgD family transcriptional regulator
MFISKKLQNSYYASLKNAGILQLTPREIDIIASIINGRTASKEIAKLLSIATKSVESNKHNINRKLKPISNLNIREFIENSDQYENFKKHYIFLCHYNEFQQILGKHSTKITKFLDKEIVIHLINNDGLTTNLCIDLELAGIKSEINNDDKRTFDDKNKIYLILSNNTPIDQNSQDNIIYLVYYSENKEEQINNRNIIYFGDNYNVSFLELIDLLTGKNLEDMDKTIERFDNSSYVINNEIANIPSENTYWASLINHLPTKLSPKLITIAIILFSLLLYNSFLKSHDDELIKSDLITPIKSAFLERNNILKEINGRFKKQTSTQSIPTVALIGVGGTGKTTIARDYGNNYKDASVIWELNAQTKYTLADSMRDLAYSLANKADLKEELTSIMKIETQQIYLKQLVQFIKTQLKTKSNWLLIYDNMVSFSEVIHFLPILKEEWGNGKVLLTTRNQHAAETSYIKPEYVVHIDTLNEQEKNLLLTKIIYGEEARFLSNSKKEDINDFLKHIPPFPLDVSIAAYSIKNTHITFGQYLQNIKNYSESYDSMQAGVIHEVSDYDKTRYGIIFSIIEKISQKNPNFNKLFFFICTLDSQKIPYKLLAKSNNLADIDEVIYLLRKNGILLNESHTDFSNIYKSISIHRITQEIGSIYFKKNLTKSQREKYIEECINSLESFYSESEDKNDKGSILLLNSHITSLIKFINQNKLQNSKKLLMQLYLLNGHTYYYWQVNYAKALYVFKQVEKYVNEGVKFPSYELAHLYKNLGSICAETLNYKDSIEYSKNSIALIQNGKDPELLIARNLRILGEVYRRIGEFSVSKDYYEKALSAIPKNKYKTTIKLRARIYTNLSELYLYRYFNDKEKGQESIRYSMEALKLIHASKPYEKLEEIPENIDCGVALHHRKFSRVLYHYSYDFDNTAKWIKSAALIIQDRCPQDMYLVGRTLFSEGGLMARTGYLISSIEKLKKAVRIHNDVLGPKTTWNVRVILSESLNRIGQFDKAYENAVFTINLDNPERNYLHNLIYLKSYYHAAYAKYRLEDYRRSYDYFVQFIKKMDKLCKQILNKAQYDDLQNKGSFTLDAFDEFNSKDSIINYMNKAFNIYSTIFGERHPFITDYIKLNLL